MVLFFKAILERLLFFSYLFKQSLAIKKFISFAGKSFLRDLINLLIIFFSLPSIDIKSGFADIP